MSFGSVRGYVQLASGLGELTRLRAMEAAQGLLSLPGMGIATGKLAGQAGALAEELFAAATTNRELLTTLVRAEVDAAVSRLGLVSADKLEEARSEAARLRTDAARLRAEVAALRSASAPSRRAPKSAVAKPRAAGPGPRTAAVKKSAVKKSAVKKSAVKKSAVKKPAAGQQ